jgi:glycosyltransferase involved in cell wall biosynthesis
MTWVTVVIPCYNAGAHLREAVESALAQTHTHLDVVIVDDGSTDPATLELLDSANWERTTILRQDNRGPAAARNHAIEAARGEFILPLDADDRIDPSYAEKALRVFERRPDVGIVYCKALRFGKESGPWMLPTYTLREMVIDNVIFITAMFRKADWQRAGGFNEHLRMGVEDYEFWLKLLSMGRDVVQIDEYLFHYRVQEVSRTTRFKRDPQAVVSTYAEIFRTNRDFFAKHAEFLFEHRFGLYQQLEDSRRRLHKVDLMLSRIPLLRRAVRWAYRKL